MSLIPLGVSGSSKSVTGTTSSWPANTVAPGAIFYLGRWTGQTLRKLILSAATKGIFYGRVQIATDYPKEGLHPANNALANPLVDLPFSVHVYNPVLSLDFAPGLVTVLPGESIYLIVYDFLSDTATDAVTWALNMFWEPLGGAK